MKVALFDLKKAVFRILKMPKVAIYYKEKMLFLRD
jgi:hypothetical protein